MKIRIGKNKVWNLTTFFNNIIMPVLIVAELIGSYCVILWMGGMWR